MKGSNFNFPKFFLQNSKGKKIPNDIFVGQGPKRSVTNEAVLTCANHST